MENETGFVNAHGFTMIGMSYFLKKPLLDVRGYFFKEFILSITLAVGAFIAVLLYRKFRQEIPLLFILLAQIVLGVYTVGHYIFPNQSYIYGDIVMGDKLKEIRMEYPGKEIFSVYEGGAQYIELVQFTDRDAHIEMIDAEFENADMSQLLSSDRILILSTDGNYAESADYYYEDKWEIGHLSIYYTP